jgi:hypothetical protein
MNLLTSLHSIFQDEVSLRWEEELDATGLEEEVEATGLEDEVEDTRLEGDLDEDGGQDSEEEEDDDEEEEGEEGCKDGAGLYDEGVGSDGSALWSASSCRVRTSHLIHPPIAPHEENRIIIIPSCDG